MSKIKAGVAMVKVLEDWGVDHLYGIPGGSFNSTMDALLAEKDHIKYIQVRNEEAGSLAAAADAKLTGKIGVAFGSAGPGATHLIQGLYDAQMDGVPVLALLGQVATGAMNYNSFQELNENPMFADVSVYNRTVMTAESLPHVVDEAIKTAYRYNGVAVVTIPVDLGFTEIEDNFVSTASTHQKGVILPADEQLKKALPLIAAAKQPVLYIGQGLRGHFDAVKAFSEHFSMPVVSAVLGKGIVPDEYENFMGFSGRVATKPGNEANANADLIIMAGSNFPFGAYFFNPNAKFIQIDIDGTKFGHRHQVDVAILGDAATALKRLTELGEARPADKWLAANQANIKNWHEWRHSFDNDQRKPLRVEPVYKEINRIAEDDAIFVVDVGNVTTHSVRHLNMNGQQRFTTSGWFATMGYGVPGGIGAQLSYPDRQVFTISGDGGFAMNMQDIITQVKYKLPIINVILTNDSLGFIQFEQDGTNTERFGVDLQDVDFGKAAEALGAKGFTVTEYDQLEEAFNAAKDSDRPVVIEVKITNDDPLPVEALQLGDDAFNKRYESSNLVPLSELLK